MRDRVLNTAPEACLLEVQPRRPAATVGSRTMGAGDKIRNVAESAGGKVKKAAGAATGNESLRAEG